MRLCLVLTATVLLGCAELPDAPTEQPNAPVFRIAANGLNSSYVFANQLAAGPLGKHRLATRRFGMTDAADGLLATPEGQTVLAFLIACALPEGTSIVASFNGDDLEFFGELGIAPRWLDHPLGEKGRGWVSACLFSRVNNLAPRTFSMRGTNRALALGPDELAVFNIEEGAFYGEYFGKGASGCSACRGAGSDAALEAAHRICTIPDPANPGFTKCGFNYAGLCSEVCRKFENGHWTRCTDGARKKPVTFDQVISTFVSPQH